MAFCEINTKDNDQQISSSDSEPETIQVREEKVEVDDKDRLQDLKEREEFAERLRNRDEANTKRKMDQQNKKILEEAAKRLKLEKDDRNKVVPKLREESRQVYLQRREEDKLAELEQEVMDEEYLWQGVKLTKYEQERLERKKRHSKSLVNTKKRINWKK